MQLRRDLHVRQRLHLRALVIGGEVHRVKSDAVHLFSAFSGEEMAQLRQW